jgi:hypothetical protein
MQEGPGMKFFFVISTPVIKNRGSNYIVKPGQGLYNTTN